MAIDRPSDELLRRILAAVAADATDARAAELIARARAEAEDEVKSVVKSAVKASLLRQVTAQLERTGNDMAPPATAAPVPAASVAPEPETAAAPASATGCYVYAITRRAPTDWAAGLAPAAPQYPLRFLAHGDVQAVISEVPLTEFSQAALEQPLSDERWIEAKVRAHDAVISAAMSGGPVIPFRFCTVVRGPDDVRRMLAEHYPRIAATLAAVEAKQEWGVKIFAGEPAAPPRPSQNGTVGAPSGTAYLKRRRTEDAARGERQHDARARAEQICQSLAALAADATVIPRRPWSLGGGRAEPLINAAFLVPDASAERFHAAVASLQSDGIAEALTLELTGPWPPYNFVRLDLSLENAA